MPTVVFDLRVFVCGSGPDLMMGARQDSSHPTLLRKLFSFPPQPPYENCSQRREAGSKNQRRTIAEHNPCNTTLKTTGYIQTMSFAINTVDSSTYAIDVVDVMYFVNDMYMYICTDKHIGT